MTRAYRAALRLVFAGALFYFCARAQGPRPDGPDGPGPPRRRSGTPARRSGGDSLLSLQGKWWTNLAVIRTLALTNDQQRALESVFQQNRLKLIDLSAALEKEEAIIEPMLAVDHPQDSHVLPQIDHIADARAALEKANARMLFQFRLILTAEQWRLLQSPGPEIDPQFPRDRGGPRPPRN